MSLLIACVLLCLAAFRCAYCYELNPARKQLPVIHSADESQEEKEASSHPAPDAPAAVPGTTDDALPSSNLLSKSQDGSDAPSPAFCEASPAADDDDDVVVVNEEEADVVDVGADA